MLVISLIYLLLGVGIMTYAVKGKLKMGSTVAYALLASTFFFVSVSYFCHGIYEEITENLNPVECQCECCGREDNLSHD